MAARSGSGNGSESEDRSVGPFHHPASVVSTFGKYGQRFNVASVPIVSINALLREKPVLLPQLARVVQRMMALRVMDVERTDAL